MRVLKDEAAVAALQNMYRSIKDAGYYFVQVYDYHYNDRHKPIATILQGIVS